MILGQWTTIFHLIIAMTYWLILLVMILTRSYYIHNLFSSTNSETNQIISLLRPKTLQSVTTAVRIRSKFVNTMCIIWPTPPSHPSFLPSFKPQSSHAVFFSSSLKPPSSPSTIGFCMGCLAFSFLFLCQTMTIHPSDPSLDKNSPDKPSLTSQSGFDVLQWSHKHPVFFPSNHTLLLMPVYMSLSFPRPWAPWEQEACLFCGQSYVQHPTRHYYMLND